MGDGGTSAGNNIENAGGRQNRNYLVLKLKMKWGFSVGIKL